MTTYDWTGSGGNNFWSNLNNWSPNSGPPGSADTADIGPDNFSVAVTGTSGVGDLDLGFFFLQQPVGSTVTVDNGGILDVDGPSDIFRASTLQSEPGGTIYLLFSGTLSNGGTILVGQDLNAGGGSSTLSIDGTVTLSGSGTLELGEVTANPFGMASTGNVANYPNTTDTLINHSNTISGAGAIVLGTFDNQAGGTVEAGLSNGGALQIAATTFSNEGALVAGSGATLNLGQDNANASLTNTGTVSIDNNGTLAIAGGYTISGGGGIALAPGFQGNTAPTAQIISDGSPAELDLVNQALKGAGTIGDADLTLLNTSGTIEADEFHQSLTLDTGSNVIANGGTLAAINDGGLVIESSVGNSGTIEANGGEIVIEDAVSVPSFPPGQHSTIDIGADGAVIFGASVAGNVTFTSGGAGLEVSDNLANGGIGGDIVGAETTDAIVFGGLSSPAQQVSWQQNGSSGTLSLTENGAVVASVNLAGHYTNSDFMLIEGAEVELRNPNPPAATTADMIMEDGINGDFEIYDLGSNAVLSGAALGQPGVMGTAEAAAAGATAGPSWQLAGLGDFNGSDTSDMTLRNSATGVFEIWDIANNNITGSAAMGQVGLEWTVAGFGDFSGNPGETDMLMRNSNTGAFEIYDLANNTITFAAPMGQVGLEWSVAGFGDFSTRANETDMLMRNSNTGAFEVYDISNNQLTSAGAMGQVGLEWSVAGFGDFSGNANETDMLMRNTNTGAFELYDISNNQITNAAPMGQVGLEWQVVGFGPINGAGTSDMLMRNTNTGAFEVYDITNNQLTTVAPMGQVGNEWSVAGLAADPPGGSTPANAQLVQGMAAYTPAGGALDTSEPLTQTTLQSATVGPVAASFGLTASNNPPPALGDALALRPMT